MAPLRYAATFDPFLSLDCAGHLATLREAVVVVVVVAAAAAFTLSGAKLAPERRLWTLRRIPLSSHWKHDYAIMR